MRNLAKDYFILARKEHLQRDFIFPAVISAVLVTIVFMTNIGIDVLWKGVGSQISTVITAFSILAGFNITSLTIFATSDSPISKKLRNEVIEGTNRPKLEQILAYFSWSIIIQLILLFLSIIASFIFQYLTISKNSCYIWAVWVIVFLGFTGTLYSIVLTIRNIMILYLYLIADARTDLKE